MGRGPALIRTGDHEVAVSRGRIDNADHGVFLFRQAIEILNDRREVCRRGVVAERTHQRMGRHRIARNDAVVGIGDDRIDVR
jgi:hypothetical protein